MIALVETTPYRRQDVGSCKEKELRHVKDVKELGAVSNIEPHPVAIRLKTDTFLAQQFEEVAASSGPPVSVGLVLVQKSARVLLRVVVVRVA